MNITKKPAPSKQKRILLTVFIIVALVAGIGGLTYAIYAQNTSRTSGSSSKPADMNLTDPTYTSEKNNDTKPSPKETEVARKNLPIIIASAGKIDNNVEVRAFVSGIIEGNGTCIATFTKGSLKITRSSKAFIDATTTQCEPISIPSSEFQQNGTWNLVMTYESPDAKGTSESMEVTL